MYDSQKGFCIQEPRQRELMLLLDDGDLARQWFGWNQFPDPCSLVTYMIKTKGLTYDLKISFTLLIESRNCCKAQQRHVIQRMVSASYNPASDYGDLARQWFVWNQFPDPCSLYLSLLNITNMTFDSSEAPGAHATP
ncbi:hypothetical protein CRYUN_Cryun40dG0085400 [Craigia yunnanensis]